MEETDFSRLALKSLAPTEKDMLKEHTQKWFKQILCAAKGGETSVHFYGTYFVKNDDLYDKMIAYLREKCVDCSIVETHETDWCDSAKCKCYDYQITVAWF